MNKIARKLYVERFSELIREGKQAVYIDETNFNLFCRKTHGWSRKGLRAVQNHPASRGSNIYLIGGISCEGVIVRIQHLNRKMLISGCKTY